jgi:hypothetical protein
MPSYKNFSQKDRQRKDSDSFRNPQNVENSKTNQLEINKLQNNKEKWKKLCSFWRW